MQADIDDLDLLLHVWVKRHAEVTARVTAIVRELRALRALRDAASALTKSVFELDEWDTVNGHIGAVDAALRAVGKATDCAGGSQ